MSATVANIINQTAVISQCLSHKLQAFCAVRSVNEDCFFGCPTGVWQLRVVPLLHQHQCGSVVRPSGPGPDIRRPRGGGWLREPLLQSLPLPAVGSCAPAVQYQAPPLWTPQKAGRQAGHLTGCWCLSPLLCFLSFNILHTSWSFLSKPATVVRTVGTKLEILTEVTACALSFDFLLINTTTGSIYLSWWIAIS